MKKCPRAVSIFGLLMCVGLAVLPAQDPGVDPPDIPIPETLAQLTNSLKTYPDGSTPPESLAREVTGAFEAALKLSPEGGVLPEYLETLAAAAAPHPQWHEMLRQLMERLKRRVARYGGGSYWHAVRDLTDMLEKGSLVPDVELSVIERGQGEVDVEWSFPGLLKSHSQAPRPRFHPWPVLAAGLAGKFDGILTEEPFGGGRGRVLKTFEALPATGKVSLTGLPSAGQLRMHLRSRENPEVIAQCRTTGFNTMPVLIDTSVPLRGSLPYAPDGLEWLSSPQPTSETHQWHVSFDDLIAHEVGPIWFVLLDEANQVVASDPIDYRSGWPEHLPYLGMKGSLIRQPRMRPNPGIFGNAKTAPVRRGGSPRKFALARTVMDPAKPPLAAINRITVREWPLLDTFNPGGRLQVIQMWQQTIDEEVPMAAGGSPLRMAWCREKKITLCEVKEQAVSEIIDLPVVASASRRKIEMLWQGSVLRLLISDLDMIPAATTLFTINPKGKAAVENLPFVLGARRTGTGEDDPLILIGLHNHFIGLLPEKGPLLTLDPPAWNNRSLVMGYLVSPTEYSCVAENGEPEVVLDWSDGTLKLKPETLKRIPWTRPLPEELTLSGYGPPLGFGEKPGDDWEPEVGVQNVWPLGKDKALGTTREAAVLFQMIR